MVSVAAGLLVRGCVCTPYVELVLPAGKGPILYSVIYHPISILIAKCLSAYCNIALLEGRKVCVWLTFGNNDNYTTYSCALIIAWVERS